MKVTCSICNTGLDTLNTAYCVKVVAWLEHKDGKYLGAPRNPSAPLGYAHKICTETRNAFDDAPTLF
jgi:hypothetical protein